MVVRRVIVTETEAIGPGAIKVAQPVEITLRRHIDAVLPSGNALVSEPIARDAAPTKDLFEKIRDLFKSIPVRNSMCA
jgi:hypothetical protein